MDQLPRKSMPTVLRNLLPQSLTAVLLAAVLLPIVYLSVPPNIVAASASGAVDQHGSRPAAAKHHFVLIRQVTFEPRVLTVGVGDTVEWKNKDIVAHTATSDKKGFDSSIIPPPYLLLFFLKYAV